MIPGIDPKIDYAFKKLCGSANSGPITLSLIDAVTTPPADERLITLDIRDPFNEKETPDDKLSIVDVKGSDQLGRLYNIEMQMQGSPIYPHRALYYWAVLYGEQLREGQQYDLLRPAISISIVNDILFPQVADFHLHFQLRSAVHPQLIFSELQAMHVVELPKFKKKATELVSPLDAWCYFLIHGANLDTVDLPTALRNPTMVKMMEVLEIMSKNELEWDRYQSRLKAHRDQQMYLNDAINKGLKEGLEKGRQEVLKQAAMDRIIFCQRLLKAPLTPREELLALALDELTHKAEALEQQLGVAKESS